MDVKIVSKIYFISGDIPFKKTIDGSEFSSLILWGKSHISLTIIIPVFWQSIQHLIIIEFE